jgi:hypothetical protein
MNARIRRLIPATLAVSLVVLWTAGAILADSRTADLDRVVARANASEQAPYRAYRRLEAGNGDSKKGWLEAWTEVAPGRGLTYEIVGEGGHEYIRNKVLRDILNSEQKLVANGQPLRAALTAANYTFADGGTTESGLLRVLLTPLKKAHGIVNGAVLIDPADGRLARIEGRLVKNPSFWLRNVDVVWKYARLGGAVVPVEVSSTGRVRMFGASSFKMVYDYETIAGRAVASPHTLARRN